MPALGGETFAISNGGKLCTYSKSVYTSKMYAGRIATLQRDADEREKENRAKEKSLFLAE
jgi:hypothetical protein